MKTSVRRLGLGVIWGAIALAPAQASAQELSFGYQWQRFSLSIDDRGGFGDFDESLTAPFGLNFDVAIPIPANLDIVGQLDWSRWSESEVPLWHQLRGGRKLHDVRRWHSLEQPRKSECDAVCAGAVRRDAGDVRV